MQIQNQCDFFFFISLSLLLSKELHKFASRMTNESNRTGNDFLIFFLYSFFYLSSSRMKCNWCLFAIPMFLIDFYLVSHCSISHNSSVQTHTHTHFHLCSMIDSGSHTWIEAFFLYKICFFVACFMFSLQAPVERSNRIRTKV